MKRGSVILEFILMMPVLLLLFGGTLLTFEVIVGKLHVQEANRNLAWLGADRYLGGSASIEAKIREYFTDRNRREKAIDSAGGNLWKVSDGGTYNVVTKKFEDKVYIGNTPWAGMMAGNIVIKTEKVSAAYMGAIAVSSVLQANSEDDAKALYRASYDISYAEDPGKDNGTIASDSFLPEAYVLMRSRNAKGEDEAEYRTDNYTNDVWKISLQAWAKNEEQNMVASEAGTADATEYRRVLYDYTQ